MTGNPLGRLAGARPGRDVERRIVEGSLGRRGGAPPWLVRFGLAGAGAAVVAAGFVVWQTGVLHVDDPPGAQPGPGARAPPAGPAPGTLLVAGSVALEVPLGRHAIELATGAQLRVETAGASTGLALEHGAVACRVQKLQAGESFRVRTEQVLVEVVGTRFSVTRDGGCTAVDVQEGRVRVTAPGGVVADVEPGQARSFCDGADAQASPGEAEVREALRLVAAGAEPERAARLLDGYLSEHAGGVFEEEALFHLCLLEDRLGRRGRASELAERFLSRFPAGGRAERLRQWRDEGRLGR